MNDNVKQFPKPGKLIRTTYRMVVFEVSHASPTASEERPVLDISSPVFDTQQTVLHPALIEVPPIAAFVNDVHEFLTGPTQKLRG